jgi:hypothetical protein
VTIGVADCGTNLLKLFGTLECLESGRRIVPVVKTPSKWKRRSKVLLREQRLAMASVEATVRDGRTSIRAGVAEEVRL